LIYLATRYNTFYVLTNNIDTKGLAYAKVLQQIMTGVYLGEVCLLGLFAINTAPGPIVLQAVFLVATAIYHAMMRSALRPLTQYLPDSIDHSDPAALFSKADHKSYDASKSDGTSPSDSNAPNTNKTAKASNKKASFFSRLFNPTTRKSYQQVRSLIPNFAPPVYTPEDAELAYYDPAVTSEVPRLWIVRDEMGISQKECRETSEVIPCTDEFAYFDAKGKVVWEERDRQRLEAMPLWEKRIDY
jgi:calcium permeable stress-gated cation channel